MFYQTGGQEEKQERMKYYIFDYFEMPPMISLQMKAKAAKQSDLRASKCDRECTHIFMYNMVWQYYERRERQFTMYC